MSDDFKLDIKVSAFAKQVHTMFTEAYREVGYELLNAVTEKRLSSLNLDPSLLPEFRQELGTFSVTDEEILERYNKIKALKTFDSDLEDLLKDD